MRRRLFNLAAAMSLVLCAAILALWCRSYAHADQLERGSGILGGAEQLIDRVESSEGVICWIHGTVTFRSQMLSGIVDPGVRLVHLPPKERPLITEARLLGEEWCGFGFARWTYPSYPGYATGWDTAYRRMMAPHCLVALLFAFAPLGWGMLKLRDFRRRRNAAAGRCLACGYDLRATPERCPECGTPATQAKPQSAEGAA